MTWRAGLLPCLLLAACLAGCGGSSSAPPRAVSDPGIDLTRAQSDELDRSLARYSRWLSDDTRTTMVARRRQIGFDSPRDSLGIDAFARRSLAEQQARRDESARLVKRVKRSIVDRYRVLGPAVLGEVLKGGWLFTLDQVLDRGLTRLHTAVGLDPTNNDAWHDLAHCCQIIGDQPGASRARHIYLQQTVTADDTERDRRCRVILDEAWSLRDEGHHQRCQEWLEANRGLLRSGRSPRQGLRPAVESDLIMGLLAAERSDLTETMRWINRLPLVDVRHGQQRHPSEYLRRWVHIWFDIHHGDLASASHRMDHQRLIRLHEHVGWRYWQDLGDAAALLDDQTMAARSWGTGMLHRPLGGFYPRAVIQAPQGALGLADADEPYIIAYRSHWLGGSFWGYTASRTLLCQVHPADQNPLLWREAMAALGRCVRRGINPGEARLLRARLNLQRGQLAAAEDDLRHAAVQRLAAGTSGGEVAFLRGVAAINGGDMGRGLDLLEQAVQRNPQGVRSWQTLAVCYAYLDRDQDAREAFDTTVRLAPTDGSAYFNRGLFHLHHGRRDAAERDLLQAVRLLDDDTRALHLLQAIHTGREVVIDQDPTPVQLVASDRELMQAAQLEAAMSGGEAEMVDVLGESPEERELWLDLLQRRHAKEASTTSRAKLAEALKLSGQPDEVTALLAPSWPDGLSSRERRILLDADRSLGHSDRALELSQLAPELLDVPTVVTAVVLLHDVGHPDHARSLLATARGWWPDQPALDELINRLR